MKIVRLVASRRHKISAGKTMGKVYLQTYMQETQPLLFGRLNQVLWTLGRMEERRRIYRA